MTEPLVSAVMLTKNRPGMADRAVRAFRTQTYQNARLAVLDTSGGIASSDVSNWYVGYVKDHPSMSACSIGRLRNLMAGTLSKALVPPEIFLHWDDDDVSHPNRIAEQVTFLQQSGADCVGYDEILFWRTGGLGEAWLYKNKLAKAGSSFCYWRRTWEQRPFPDQPRPGVATGEDFTWGQGVNLTTQPGFLAEGDETLKQFRPAVICSIHGGNTSKAYESIAEGPNWKRLPIWDEYARKVMAL